MPDPKTLFAKLRKLEGAVNEYVNPHLYVIRSPSPSLNFCFGNGWGLPAGYSLILWGPPKGGKSLVANAMIGQLHQDDDKAYAIKFNTERRESAQLTPQALRNWGIDTDRYLAYETNTPDQVYDYICKDIAEMCQQGLPLKFVVIDSINDIVGRRAMNADSVMVQQRGDQAATNQEGLGRVLGVQRKYGFALAIVAQQRAEQDTDEQMRGNTTKAGVANAVFHHCEYNMHVERDVTAAGKTDLEGRAFRDDTVSRQIYAAENKRNDGDQIGHKIRVVMKDSSMGPKMRMGEFTIEYDKGVVNVHEEVFLLGINRNIIDHKAGSRMYAFGNKEWGSKAAILEELRKNLELQEAILKELKRRDMAGAFAAESVVGQMTLAEVEDAEKE